MGNVSALEEAVDLSVDPDRFTEEEMRTNLTELSVIAHREGLSQYYLGILFTKVVKKESNGEDF